MWANTSLTKLVCIINEISSLNLSNNPALTYLNCSHNKLTSLDISNNTALTYMGCSQNPGDSVSRFPIYAWFDNDSKPANFQKPLWTYEVKPGEFKDIIPHYSIKIR